MRGAPERTRSHYDRILALLRERGERGILGSELYSQPELYGRSPRNRISELRRDGHLIEGRAHGSSDWHYRLICDNAAPIRERSESAYMRRVREEDAAAMPLFVEVEVRQ